MELKESYVDFTKYKDGFNFLEIQKNMKKY